ncbi:hypothetical protein [Streptomyces sp. SID3343]|uniref:hypothetical protein n=1 Tax=Streptomyces sp. SID3343 TaxID=2690260 RepID=UPI00136DE565|nr:hypothetical protein [Streptomyces sp. SID3343]MYV99229.1 hypothetical protein [Streptomyces sp. SID3343]
MSDDTIHIVPAEGQNAQDVAKVLSGAARAQNIEDTVRVDGDRVLLARAFAPEAPSLAGFPPESAQYRLSEPIELDDRGDGPQIVLSTN